MMNALQLAQRLQRDAGMEPKTAEVFAQAVDEYMQANTATKADIELVRADLKVGVSELKGAIVELKTYTWQVCLTVCGAVGVIQIGVIYALLVRLAGHA